MAIGLPVPVPALARAAATSARCGSPVDVAVWVMAELLACIPHADSAAVDDVTVLLRPRSIRCNGLDQWVRQLRGGAGWTANTLPTVWVPTRIGHTLDERAVDQAVTALADVNLLRAGLRLECAAAAAGRTITEVLLSRRARAPAA